MMVMQTFRLTRRLNRVRLVACWGLSADMNISLPEAYVVWSAMPIRNKKHAYEQAKKMGLDKFHGIQYLRMMRSSLEMTP